jgi:hypothetical protein
MSRYINRVVNYDMSRVDTPDHIYVDISVLNNDYGEGEAPQLKFTETRSQAFLHDPSQWCVSVERFHIDTVALPAMIPIIQPNQNDVNKTIYSFTMKYKTYEYQQYVNFIPQNQNISAPSSPVGDFQDMTNDYYMLNSYGYFVSLLNKALKTCFDELNSLVVAGSDELATDKEPWFSYDPSTQDIILNADILAFEASLTDPIELFFNVPMYNLLSSFPTFYYGNTISNGKCYKVIQESFKELNIVELGTTNYLQTYQEYPCTSQWSCIQSICICSSTLPFVGTNLCSPTVFGTRASIVKQGDNMTVPLLTDFEVSLNTGLEYKPSINMVPNYPRLIDLQGHSQINSISIEIYYKDIYSNFHPLKLPSNCNANIKLCFYHKSLLKK